MLDHIDKELIEHLQADGRQTASDLAQQVGLSVPAVAERIRKLQEQGIILGFAATVDPKTIGMDVGAYITVISESSAHYEEVIARAQEHPEVLEVMSVTGEGSHLLHVRTRNTGTLEQLLGQIQSWPGVTRTETRIILSSYKEQGIIRVPEQVIKQN
ncbi:MAG: Lrp/AsnC family transcriptional regulator [Fidelibacterota bacterium]|nr:MAG: Lrp/AsnC family transcriptional regulator [Candidatus Neomarinimicrobiota bacterium]